MKVPSRHSPHRPRDPEFSRQAPAYDEIIQVTQADDADGWSWKWSDDGAELIEENC